MTGALDAGFAALATRLTNRYGKPMTLRRVATAVVNPATGKSTATTTNYSVNGSPPAPVRLTRRDFGLATEGLIMQGDAEVIIAAAGLTITPDPVTDRLVIDSVVWKIVAADPLYSGEDVAAWVLVARK